MELGRKKVILLHRDLAARNILLKHGTAQVSDFGMALSHGLTESTSIDAMDEFVPVKWMAPEALMANTFSTKTDIYSFGVVIWEIVTGQVPWKGVKLHLIIEKSINGERLPIPPNCPPGLKEIMQRCWNQTPEERPEFTEICDFLNDREEYIKRGDVVAAQQEEGDAYYNNQQAVKTASRISHRSKLLEGLQSPEPIKEEVSYVSFVSTRDLLVSSSNRADNVLETRGNGK